jgi:hypothetical protein
MSAAVQPYYLLITIDQMIVLIPGYKNSYSSDSFFCLNLETPFHGTAVAEAIGTSSHIPEAALV